MELQRVWTVAYSATGNTKKVVTAAAEAAAEQLAVPLTYIDFSTPESRAQTYTFGPTDLVFAATPTYAGKMPNKLLPDFQTRLQGNGAMAAAVVTFGNRNFDNSLAELCATLEEDGFHTLSGGAFVGQHAFALALASDRPNAEDLAEAREFGRKTAEKAQKLTELPTPVVVRGDAAAPYYVPKGVDGQPVKFLKAKPQIREELCVGCGVCVDVCPVGSVDPENVANVPGICIKCQACVRHCPTGAKYFDDPAFLDHKAMLEQTYTAPQKNELFY